MKKLIAFAYGLLLSTPVNAIDVPTMDQFQALSDRVTALEGGTVTPPPIEPPVEPPPIEPPVEPPSNIEPWQWAEDGAIWEYYNKPASLKWRNLGGDWLDINMLKQGNAPWAMVLIPRGPEQVTVEIDITQLALQWISGSIVNRGVLIYGATGTTNFASRESQTPPILMVDGAQIPLVADTYLDKSTAMPAGNQPEIKVSGGTYRGLIRWDLSGITSVASATMTLTKTKSEGGYDGVTQIEIYAADSGEIPPVQVSMQGISSQYINDVGLAEHPSVDFYDDFESGEFIVPQQYEALPDLHWSRHSNYNWISILPEAAYTGVYGYQCHMPVQLGDNEDQGPRINGGCSPYHDLKDAGKAEPKELYMRFVMRFKPDIMEYSLEGGKLPGMAGTYWESSYRGGVGHQPGYDGSTGWSARGHYSTPIKDERNPLYGYVPIGVYIYHVDQLSTWGDEIVWSKDYNGYLEIDRWYNIEWYIKLNTPHQKDGIVRGWVDGKLAYERTDFEISNEPQEIYGRGIERAPWLSTFFGGRLVPSQPMHIEIDNVVTAFEYIGPVNKVASNGF